MRVIFAIVMALISVVWIPIYTLYYLSTERVVTAKIVDKERVVQGYGKDASSRFLVFTDQGEFEVVDSLLYFDWRASSRYGSLIEDSTCVMTVVGWRWGFLSLYPNVVEVHNCQ